mmetsp:Transcript_26347/g.39915  ORF Transcript_26347/g.39915 Transcript_26347/m.39915 type:complete len:138 (-) Transcript_26347:200-613(-)
MIRMLFTSILLCAVSVQGFTPVVQMTSLPKATVCMASSPDNEEKRASGFFKKTMQEFGDMFSNLDDVIDDFYNKRMGKGEIFYGKRKYKPSGEVDGTYNGFGLSDKQRIDETREMKEFYLELKKIRQEKLEKDKRKG